MSASMTSGFAPNWNWTRPMRNVAPPTPTEQGVMRPPDQGAASLPRIITDNNFGIGGGVGIGGNADGTWGLLLCFVGLAPFQSGVIRLNWPIFVTNTYQVDWATLNVTGNGVNYSHLLYWTSKAPLVTSSQPILISYQRTVAQ